MTDADAPTTAIRHEWDQICLLYTSDAADDDTIV